MKRQPTGAKGTLATTTEPAFVEWVHFLVVARSVSQGKNARLKLMNASQILALTERHVPILSIVICAPVLWATQGCTVRHGSIIVKVSFVEMEEPVITVLLRLVVSVRQDLAAPAVK